MIANEAHRSALDLAESAYAMVQADAAAAAELAERALRVARAQADAEAIVAALHALSFARHELGDPRSIRTIRSAIRIGERHGLVRRTALARRRLAMDLATRGAALPALRELAVACAALDAHERARSEVFRIAILGMSASENAPLAETDQALRTLRRKRDVIWEARLRRNRGQLLAERGDADRAESDLVRARELYDALGATEAALGTEIQLARIALSRGDLPTCIARLDAIELAGISPLNIAELELLRAQAFTRGRLRGEALQALEQAEAIWRRSGVEQYEGRLEAIRLTLLAGDPGRAYELARAAQRSFAARGRAVHSALAAGLALASATAAGTVRPDQLRSGRHAAATLAAAGWRQDAHRVRLAVARAAIELGSASVARRELTASAARLRRGPIADRIEAWHVEALIRLADGDDAGAQAAARRGLRLLEDHRAALGAADLRATASSIGAELAGLGLRIALTDGRPALVLAWAEALRASALRLAPVTPPDSKPLRDGLAELRRVSTEIAQAEHEGRSTRALVARQARSETQVRRFSRHAAGDGRPTRAARTSSAIAAALGDRALVEYVELDGQLTAVTLVRGRLARHELGALAPLAEQLEWLGFALTRLAHLKRRAPQRATLLTSADAAAAALEERLVGPLAATLGSRELVIVPTGALHDLPWSILPGMRDRALTVSPSAAAWSALRASGSRRRRVVLAAGPRLRHASAEIAALAELHPRSTILTGSAASAAGVLRALDGAAIAHLACHGRFRADSPLFSSLELADGPLNAYELQRLRRAPELIVLSCCDLAVSDAHPGDELLGFAAGLLDMGTRCVIASLVPVPDAAAKHLMLGLHRELIAAASPAVALARAQAGLPRREAALQGFVCFGSG